jgi:dihydroorotate dehydrogenase
MEGMYREFEPTPELIQAISGPHPIAKEETEELAAEEYQQTLEQALEGALKTEQMEGGTAPYRTLQIDEVSGQVSQNQPPVQVTKLAPDLDSMTVNELKALAKEKGVTIPANTRRKEIIDLIRKATGGIQGTSLEELGGPEPPAGGASLDSTELEAALA